MTLTKAPITPGDVSLRYSNGLVFEVVLRNGYKNSKMWAAWSDVTPSGQLVGRVAGTDATRKLTIEEQLPRFGMPPPPPLAFNPTPLRSPNSNTSNTDPSRQTESPLQCVHTLVNLLLKEMHREGRGVRKR